MMLAKAKGAVLVLDRFSSLTRRIYLFGTSKKLKFEIEKEEKVRWFVIMPEGKVRMCWNFVVLLLLMYTAIFVPFQTAFVEDDTELSKHLETLMDSMFITDFFLNFLMAYEDRDKKIEIRLRYIAMNYLQGWLMVDLLSCIPFQMLTPSTDNSLSSID
jgi:Ion transport protein